jgi:thiamine-monophosphate kinase
MTSGTRRRRSAARGADSTEAARIARLVALYRGGAEGVERAIGDDAAVLRPRAGEVLVWTVDTQVDGVHFRRDLLSLEDVGHRATMAAASDVAAMGARPWCALSALALPRDVDDAAFDAIARGVARASDELSAPVVGGNLSRAGELSITTTVLGASARVVARDGARPGDVVLLAGRIGMAAAGLAALQRGLSGAEVAPCIDAWRRPRALVGEGLRMGAVAHAAIDVSDGLARDLGHVARASGVRVVLDEAALLAHAGQGLADAARVLGLAPLDLALHGGEDYALAVTAPSNVEGFTRIGVVEEGGGVWLATTGAPPRKIEERGFEHF